MHIPLSRLSIILATLSCLLTACSGLKTYRSNYERNLLVTTNTEARGLFSGVDAALDIYSVQDDCARQYEGTVDLGNSIVEVGIPTEQPAVLVFRFESSAFLSNSHSSMGYDVMLYPLANHVYDVDVSYKNSIYNVEVQERPRGAADGEAMIIAMQDQPCSANL